MAPPDGLVPVLRLLSVAVCLFFSFPVMGQTPPNEIPPPPVFKAAPATRTTGLENTPVRTKPLSSNAVGTLSPESGKWHSFVTVKGPAFAKAERVAVIWYTSDDATQAQAGSITATLRKRMGTDEIEIEMPRDAGGPSGGVVRVYLFMPDQLQPVLAGRFTVNNQLTAAPLFPPITVTASSIQLTGTHPPVILVPTALIRLAGTRIPPKLIMTQPIQLTGTRR